ncbi:trypsin-like peptidase domain-containing protein [Exiguobacterium sp. SL14]|nr:trypsin-like peptidase domain-containing protein [Exiguobacterium sp. SL14]MCY1691711.1 trypsin-like peptidase domain-containing protein [Exiguobacterium sp. SL14]
MTNHHVVDGASKLDVTLNDGKTLSAKLLGSDETYDLAVLEVDASDVPGVITLGKSADLKAGQTVLAIGNPLGEFQNSVTRGIVSSKDRTVRSIRIVMDRTTSIRRSSKRIRHQPRKLRWCLDQ